LSIKRRAKEDGEVSEFSGVLNTVTEDDIKYKNIEINTKLIKEKFKFHIEKSMQGITGYDIDKIIN
jgi:outer membrane lipoprotein-sorting protein